MTICVDHLENLIATYFVNACLVALLHDYGVCGHAFRPLNSRYIHTCRPGIFVGKDL